MSDRLGVALVLAASIGPVAFFWAREWWRFERSTGRKKARHDV